MGKLISGSGEIEQSSSGVKLPELEVPSIQVGGSGSSDTTAALEIKSTTKGLLLPRLTTTQRDAINSPTAGLMIYDSTLDRSFLRGSSGWRRALSEEPSGTFSFPTLTQTQRDAVSSPANGMMIFNSTKRDMQVYRNGSWQNMGTPAGTIMPFAGTSAPDGWLFCDGSQVSRTTYSDLFSAVGIAHGSGDNSTTFHIPDYRGRFLRGVDGGAGRDPDRTTRTSANTGGNTGDAVGSVQGDQFRSHTHDVAVSGTTNAAASNARTEVGSGLRTSTATGGNETRPVNANVHYIIKF